MKLRLLLPLIFATATIAQGDNEIGFIERFALAPDREKVLTELVPGTEDYYFYHGLHYQNTRQAPKLATILDAWKKRYPNSERRKVIENREALLAYDADPQRTLDFLKRFFNLQFNHVQERRDQRPDLPTTLDQARIGRDAFRKVALVDDDLSKCSDEELAQLVIDKVELRPAQRRALLARIQRPNVAGLVELIAADLSTPENHSFGEFPIHQQLLPEQLDQLAKLVPRMTAENAYVFTRIRKLAPGADDDATFDAASREAWLDRLWSYVKSLPPAFNSLKASVLYKRLDHDRRLGTYNAERFVEYLKLPRQTNYAAPRWLERLRAAETMWSDLNASFGEAGLTFAPIQNDESLVRDYFLRLFVSDQTKTWEAYVEWVRDTWLKPLFAEAMIVNGIGDSEKWASLLSPAAYQKLKERVDLDFALENPQFHAPAAEVSIDVFVKNTPKLIVKVYELNALNYFLTHKRQLNTDLPLDGLVANAETTHAYDDSPFRRVRRNYKFPELKDRRGAWVVEFIGGGRSSRALVRKGQWHLIQQTGPAGDQITVVDETYAPVKDAAAWLDGRKFTTDPKSGAITIPFTEQPGRKPVVLADATGTFATLTEFEHHAEQYQLDAQFHIEREQLLAGREATLAIRTALRLHESELSLSLLKDTKLTITTTSLDGIRTIREIKDVKLDAGRLFTHKFQVPGRLAKIEANLTAKVDLLSKGGEKQEVYSSRPWTTNAIDQSEATSIGHLVRTEAGYFLDLLGKNGEPLADRQVVVSFYHKRYRDRLQLPLRTDARGRVALGVLDQIGSVLVNTGSGAERRWPLMDFARSHNDPIHAVADTAFEIPLNRWLEPGRFSLLEVRNETFAGDATKRIVLMPMGPYIQGKDGKAVPGVRLPYLPVTGLPPGDYKLFLPDEDRTIDIKITKGATSRDWAMNPARSLQLTPTKPLHIARVSVEPDALVIHLANSNPFTRVHIAATRYVSYDPSLRDLLSFSRFGKASEIPERLPNLFAGGRDIGDEYRYILERRYAQKFPGNMLARPGLLLNPWEKRTTDQAALEQEVMQKAKATAGGRARQAQKPAPDASVMFGVDSETNYVPPIPNLDFLANTGPVLYNSLPDKDGVIRIDRKLLGDRQLVQIYAEDLQHGIWKEVALPEVDAQLKDQRLTRNLDPAKPFAEKKQIDVLQKGQTLALQDILSSEIETYDTIGSVFSLLQTLSGDGTLAKFAWILEWPKMNDADKRAKYSEFACHELHVFLSRKDPDFFSKVVLPYLRNKKDKTFIDEYLLGTDLRRYLEPWRFAQLNAAERALLTSRLPGEAADIARTLRELWELIPPNPDETDRLFETALRGRSLDASAAGLGLEFDGAKSELAAAAPALADAPGAPAAPAPTPADATRGGAPAARGMAIAPKEARDSLRRAETLNEARQVEADTAAKELKLKASKDPLAGQLGREADSYYAFMDVGDVQAGRLAAQAYYRRLGPTKEWAENNYYHLPIQEQNAELIHVNAFWRDLAAHIASGAKGPFVSTNVAEAHRNFAEIMLALAVTDLPFEAPKHETKIDGGSFTVTAGGVILAVHKEIKPAAPAPQTELLVSQNFYRFGDRYRNEGNEKFDKYITAEFLAGAVYGANIVVTNPTSSPQKLELLLQIPRGAMATNSSKPTDSRRIRLEPFTTQSFEYFFYFPSPGAAQEDRFAHYPVHVARNEQVVGSAKAFDFRVVRQLSQVDKASWDYVSQYGTDAEVFTFLEQNNIERLDVTRVAWRCRQNVDFFRRFTALLAKRHRFDPTIYSYGVLHNEVAVLSEWLRHRDELLLLCGPTLDSRLVKLDPIERKRFEQLEYSPLINQRAHRLGSQHRIANNVLLEQYRSQLDILAYKPSMDAMDVMAVTGFLFLQDRVEEALALLQSVNAEALPTRIQYDYFRCYAAFYNEKTAEARGIANQYVNFPVARWRNLFADVLAQLSEIEGQNAIVAKDKDTPDRERDTTELAATQPSFDFKVENRAIRINWRNLNDATLNYYLIDPEFSFSSNPFVSEDATRFSIIKPTKTASIALPQGKDAIDVPLPDEFARANVVVELVAAGQRKAQAYHANSLKLTVAENYGRIELRDQGNGRAVPKAYVKVYARLNNGTVRFFKDGYTDLRGKFDYASLNSNETPETPRPLPVEPGSGNLDTQMLKPGELDQVSRMAFLILSDQNGALVKEVNPPVGGASHPIVPIIPGL